MWSIRCVVLQLVFWAGQCLSDNQKFDCKVDGDQMFFKKCMKRAIQLKYETSITQNDSPLLKWDVQKFHPKVPSFLLQNI